MRTTNLLKTVFYTACFSVCFSSCSNENLNEGNENNSDMNGDSPKEYVVSFNYTGEITNIETSPLSRNGENNNIYGIQVYSCPTDTNAMQNYNYYAYGIFNDKSQMSIRLTEGYKYKFIATMIVDGVNRISHYNDVSGEYYNSPFNSPLNNRFIYTSNNNREYNFQYGSSNIYTNEGYDSYYDRPNIDRYYGETYDYIPSENGSVSINMKRTVFGVKVVTEDFTEGTIKVKMEYAPEMSITYPETECSDIFTFQSVSQAYWSSNYTDEMGMPMNYSESVTVSITRLNADSLEIPVATQSINFERNKLTTLTVKIVSNSDDNDVNIGTEDEEMGEGDNIIFEGGGDLEVPVEPEV